MGRVMAGELGKPISRERKARGRGDLTVDRLDLVPRTTHLKQKVTYMKTPRLEPKRWHAGHRYRLTDRVLPSTDHHGIVGNALTAERIGYVMAIVKRDSDPLPFIMPYDDKNTCIGTPTYI